MGLFKFYGIITLVVNYWLVAMGSTFSPSPSSLTLCTSTFIWKTSLGSLA